MRVYYAVLLIIALSSAMCQTDEGQLLYRTLDSLNRALQFINKKYLQLNIDGVLGGRIVADQIESLLKKNDEKLRGCPSLRPLHKDLEKMFKKAQVTTERGIQSVARRQPKYYARIGGVLNQGLYLTNFPQRRLTPVKVKHEWHYFDESKSDKCIAKGIGSYGLPPCNITNDCWTYLTAPDRAKYTTTHQVLYLELMEGTGCGSIVEELSQKTYGKSVQDLMNNFCYSIYLEAKDFEENGYPQQWQDLLMEQIALCGILGYRDFFQPQWVEKILSLQAASGCYTRPEYTGIAKRRRKREDIKMDGGCSAHKTAVALGAMAVSVRFMLDDFLDNYKCSKNLIEEN